MKKLIIISVFLIFGCSANNDTNAQESDEIFTLYLVRHSEKDLTSDNQSDPPLTECGEKRSDHLSNFLEEIDLDVIYSTNYTRTKNTALPTALSKELEVRQYKAQKLKDFSKVLIESKQNALVVGHSNTTAVLAGLLVNQTLGAFNLDIYNRIYKVKFKKDNGELVLIHSNFKCP
jgi:broad specificity phosphatase PhoE